MSGWCGWLVGGWLMAALLGLAGCAPPAEEGGPQPGAEIASAAAPPAPRPVARFADGVFIAADGARLPLRRWLPDGAPKAVILGLHGFNDYSHAFAAPAAAWAKDGIATYAYDQRGFGAAPERGRWPGRDALAAEAAAACGILRRLYPGVPLYLLGESMGGAVAVVTMSGESGTPIPDVDGVILAAPAVWGRATMDLVPRVALWIGVRFAPGLTLTGQSLHILASDNIPMLRALGRDPLVIKQTRVDTIWGLVNLMDAALAAAPRLRAPLLLIYGAHDEIIPKRAMRRFVRDLPPQPRGRRSFSYYRHGYHMLLRDLEGPLVSVDVAGWILAPSTRSAAGLDRRTFEADLGGPASGGAGRAALARR